MDIRVILILLLMFAGQTRAKIRLNITAIGAYGGHSTLKCWGIDSPVLISHDRTMARGMIALLGDVSNISWTVLPPTFDNGIMTLMFS